MNRKDELYYSLKSLRQTLEFYEFKAARKYPGAKIRVKNLKRKISDLSEEFLDLN